MPVFAILDALRDALATVLPAALAEFLVLAALILAAAAGAAALMVAPRPQSRVLAVGYEAVAATLVLALSSAPIIATWWWGHNLLGLETAVLDGLRDALAPALGHLATLVTALGFMAVSLLAAYAVWRLAPPKSDVFARRFQRSLVAILAASLASIALFALWWLHVSGPDRVSDPADLESAVIGVAVVWMIGLVIALALTLVGWIVETNVGRMRVALIATAVVAVLVVMFVWTDILPQAWKRDTVVMLLASLVGAWVWLFHGLGPRKLRLGLGARHHRTPQ